MTIDEAIKILTPASKPDKSGRTFNFQEAIKLGIEALNRIRAQRVQYPEISSRPLPGETKD